MMEFEPQLSRSSLELRVMLSECLSKNRDDIMDTWMTWMREKVASRAVHALPEQALLNHIPPVLDSLASFLRTPIEASRSETIGHLQLHARIRKDQGYDLQTMLVEFDYLSHLVGLQLIQCIRDSDRPFDAGDLAEAFNLLNSGLRAMSFVTVQSYQDKDSELSDELSRRLEELASTMMHELRQPLNTIAIGTSLLATEAVATNATEREHHVEVVQKSIKRTTDLLEDIRIIALAENARINPHWTLVETLLHRVLDSLRDQADRAGVRMEIENPVPAIEIDSVRLHLVLVNLVSNGIKYCNRERSVRTVRISVQWGENAELSGRCEIRIKDNGIGVPVEAREHIFERHFRAHPEHAEGLGLGLALSQTTIAQIGGRIWIEESSDEGSTFVVRVPGRGAKLPDPAAREKAHDIMSRSLEVITGGSVSTEDAEDDGDEKDDAETGDDGKE